MRTHFKYTFQLGIFLIVLLIQSCTSTKLVTDPTQQSSNIIEVITKDGFTYVIPWYEAREGMLVSKLNTTRFSFNKNQIIEVANYDPEPHKVDLIDALNHYGDVSVVAYDKNKRVLHYRFYDIDEYQGKIVGYSNTGDYAADIRIPLNNVKKINVHTVEDTQFEEGWYILGAIALECLIWYATCPATTYCY